MAGYTRQDTTGQLANGNPIDADIFNDEYDAIEGAFNASSGHSHDGSAGGGAPIEDVGPSQELKVDSSAVFPKTDNVIDSGKAGLRWRNGYFGTDILVDNDATIANDASVGNDLSVTNDATVGNDASVGNDLSVTNNATVGGNATVTGNTVLNGSVDLGDAAFDTITFNGVVDSDIIPSAGTENLGSAAVEWNDLFIDGTATIDTLQVDEDATVTGNLDVTGTFDVTGASNFDSTVTSIGGFIGDVTGNADTATAWQTSRTLSLTGDVTGTVSGVDGTGNISIATTIQPNSVALGTDTTGNYVASLVAGTGVTLTNNTGEGATPTVAIGQDVGTTSNVTFNDVTATGNLTVAGSLTVSGTTTTVNTETINLADNQIVLNSNYTGSSPTENGGIEIERGTLDNKTLVWDETADKWTVGSETFVAGTFEGALTGNVTGTTIQFDTGLTDGTITIDGFVDEDDMVSDSATKVPTQQSVKAYVDAAVAGDGTGTIDASSVDATDLSVTTSGGLDFNGGAATGWVVAQNSVTNDLEFIYNGVVQFKMTSTGTLNANDDIVAAAF